MGYQTILLHLDNEAQATELIEFASTVASKYQAHLIGLFVVQPLQLYIGRASGVSMAKELSDSLIKDQIDLMKRLQAIFETEPKNTDHIAEWRFIDERMLSVADTLLQEATTADLVIVGQSSQINAHNKVVDDLLLSSPTPVLVIPEKTLIKTFAKNILIAWDGKLEVARAVNGARPILQSAENVYTHHVRSSTDADPHAESNMKELAENLSRHGVQVELSETVVGIRDVGKSISEKIQDYGVDCVVMGAYGHSKIRNLILGNTTDYALKNFNVPLLMWH